MANGLLVSRCSAASRQLVYRGHFPSLWIGYGGYAEKMPTPRIVSFWILNMAIIHIISRETYFLNSSESDIVSRHSGREELLMDETEGNVTLSPGAECFVAKVCRSWIWSIVIKWYIFNGWKVMICRKILRKPIYLMDLFFLAHDCK